MAKRKRLTPAQSDYLDTASAELETKSMGFPARAPIAQVAGEASSAAALDELAGELRRAREEGRMIQAIPLGDIDHGYLTRDRILANDADLDALKESIRNRGQQTPIEVVELEQGRFGLISGWRRLTALRQLSQETAHSRFDMVQAVLRKPETASDAYVAMVEENEVRLGLSYYERARIAAKSVEQGVFDTEKDALLQLFASSSRAKRSKIKAFISLYHALDDLLLHGSAIPERLGLSLAKALDDMPNSKYLMRTGLESLNPNPLPEDELQLLQHVVSIGEQRQDAVPVDTKTSVLEPKMTPEKPKVPSVGSGRATVSEGVEMRFSPNKVELRGRGVTAEFREALEAWIKSASAS